MTGFVLEKLQVSSILFNVKGHSWVGLRVSPKNEVKQKTENIKLQFK